MFGSKEELIQYLYVHYPEEKNEVLARQLGISKTALATIASRNNIKKSSSFLKKQHEELMLAKLKKYNKNLKSYILSQREQNILAGSILGDGSLALYGRSKHAHYREHGAPAQLPYRLWKVQQLAGLDFKADRSGNISSPSNPLYTELMHHFYQDGRKIILPENLQLLSHPIGLACLYMDDGSLVIDINRKKNRFYLFPRIYIYSLNFTREENQLLRDHLENRFGIPFKLKKHPDGEGTMLELNRRNEVLSFIQLIAPFVEQIPCMTYKIEAEKRMQSTKARLERDGRQNIILSPLEIECQNYSASAVDKIIQLKNQGIPDRIIAEQLRRSYWGIVDKIRRLRQEELLE